MGAFLFYSIESAICLLILLLPYLIWFRKTTYFQWNRFYLLGAVFFSLLAPLVNIEIETATAPKVPQIAETLFFFQEVPAPGRQLLKEEGSFVDTEITKYAQEGVGTSKAVGPTISWDWEHYSSAIYIVGLLVLGGLFLYRLSMLWRLFYRGKRTKYPTFTIVDLHDDRVFSFFHLVFLDRDRYGQEEKDTLLKHEQVHVQQVHSLDVLVLEVLKVVFWFNPLYGIYLKYLQQEHEYFVDATTSRMIGQSRYAQLLLSMAVARPPLIGHAFAYIPVKHRICKLFQKSSTNMEKSKYFIPFPIFISLFFVFSCSIDELGSLEDNNGAVGKKVRDIKAYFMDERSVLKQEIDVGSIELNEDGTIADMDIKGHPIFGENIPSTHTRRNYLYRPDKEFFNSLPKDHNKPTDFSKLAKWLLAGDIAIGVKTVFYISNYGQGKLILDFERHIAEKYDNVQIKENSFNFDRYSFSFKGNRSFYKENALIEKSATLTKEGRLEVLTEHEIVEFPPFEHTDPRAYSLQRSESYIKKELYYSIGGLLEGMQTKYTEELDFSNGKKSDSPYSFMGGSFRFLYDDRSNITEVEIFNAGGMYLRKYRFHYNEVGYCTKKELINREGNVEFSVRFAYGFYD